MRLAKYMLLGALFCAVAAGAGLWLRYDFYAGLFTLMACWWLGLGACLGELEIVLDELLGVDA